MNDDVFRGLGVPVELIATPGIDDPKEKFSDAFRVIVETLTRMGIASRKTKTLYQSCNLLHKKGRYAILHFKELFLLDNKPAAISDDDLARRNLIAKLLSDWGLLRVTYPEYIEPNRCCPISQLKIVSFQDKKHWNLQSKYSIGKKLPDANRLDG